MALTAEALAVSGELLRCASPTLQARGPDHLDAAILIGDLRLVALVLDLFPESAHSAGSTVFSGAVGWACRVLCDELPEQGKGQVPATGQVGCILPSIPQHLSRSPSFCAPLSSCPRASPLHHLPCCSKPCLWCLQWDLEDACPVLHGCKLVATLLGGGALPQKVLLVDERLHSFHALLSMWEPPKFRLPRVLAPVPGPVLRLWVPLWALEPLRCGRMGRWEGPCASGACKCGQGRHANRWISLHPACHCPMQGPKGASMAV